MTRTTGHGADRSAGLRKRAGRGTAILLLALWAVTAELFAGRPDKAGTAAAPELLIPVGAASIGYGGAGIATATGVDGIFWNPAGLARTEFGSSVIVSHMAYLADINLEYAAAALNFTGVGAVGLSVKSLAIGDIPVTTEEQPDGTGETTSPAMLVVGGTFARKISDRISMGVTVTYIYESMAKVSASGVCFTAGVQYTGLGGIDGLEFGVALKNLGPGMQYSGDGLLRNGVVVDASRPASPILIQAETNDLPSSIDIGLGYTMKLDEENALLISSSFLNNNYTEDEYELGGQYSYQQRFFVRGGYDFSNSDYIYGATFGFGVKTVVSDITIQVDYAYRSVQYFSGNHVISLQFGL